METKILGIILSILGIASLILAVVYVNGADSSKHLNLLFTAGILGTIIFFAGIRMVPGQAGKAGKEELPGIKMP
jgi:hypothetical protein